MLKLIGELKPWRLVGDHGLCLQGQMVDGSRVLVARIKSKKGENSKWGLWIDKSIVPTDRDGDST